ncbi:MAG: hypothetical protein EBS05_04115 [Proteobacteria bacterium]|nr:hypothetical protein [Pseudomonadota bacterium]
MTNILTLPEPTVATTQARGRVTRESVPRVALSLRAVIDLRLLINYRVAPEVLARLLPPPFRPKVVHRWGLAGICLLRLREVRPVGLPAFMGMASENAAHRIAVEWEDAAGHTREGVFILRRDTASRFNQLVGGRLFPGVHHAADFHVWEPGNRFKIGVFLPGEADRPLLRVHAHLSDSISGGSVFHSLPEAVEFFRAGSLGWSPGRTAGELDGMELSTRDWRLEPLAVDWVDSAYFAAPDRFPAGSCHFDSAFLMREVACEWHARGQLKAGDFVF